MGCRTSTTTSLAAPRAWIIVLAIALGVRMPCSVTAAKFNVTKSLKSTLVVAHEPPDASCIVPGICTPVNQTIPGNTLYYWCGFLATHRSRYYTRSFNSKVNVTTQMMREEVLQVRREP